MSAVNSMSAKVIPNTFKPALSRAELVEQAREIGEFAWQHRERADKDRRMPDEVVEKLRASGLMKLCRHRKWGRRRSRSHDISGCWARNCPRFGGLGLDLFRARFS